MTGQSGRLICGYVYCSAGDGESTQDVVYSGHNLIAENGTLLAESRRFCNESIYTELDMVRLNEERRRMSIFMTSDESYINVEFSLKERKNRTEPVLWSGAFPCRETRQTVKNAARRFLGSRPWD